MKIAIACLNISWQSGGPRLIFSMAQALKKQGHTVVIYAPDFTGQYYKELWEGLDIRVVPPPEKLIWTGRPASLWQWVWRKYKQEKLREATNRRIAEAMDGDFDVLNVHDFAYPIARYYRRRNPKVKVLWTENDPPYMYLPKRNPLFSLLSRIYNAWKDFSSRPFFRAIDEVAVLDGYNERWARERGLDPKVIRLGVDFDAFYQPVKDFASKAAGKEVRLMGLGSLNSFRHYEDIVEAVALLREWGYAADAKIIANDQWNESEYREKIVSLAAARGVSGFVDFRFQGVSEEGLREAYAECDVFVYPMYLPPPRNGFGFSIGVFEAIASGLPLVLCRTTTSTEILADGKTALFVDPMRPDQIAEKVRRLVDDPALYAAIGRAGQELVKEKLSWDRYAREMLALLVG